ncbi:DUF2505 domain-containing protein [Umezawaea beigongshangensis]|uniref:DUF2505 domain-containing protein n=1 Tax=Umezawaea beigongshangensis TaxID=2780383 RepID=UPI0018F227DC|nr:DUF2505 domain-containing protein [Umezawaea beigongshangensis]
MARRIEHLTTYPWTARDVFGALTSEDHVRDRLAALGGNGAELISFSGGNGETRFELKQGVSAEHLPPVARNVLGGDLVIQRTETWRADDLAGAVEVTLGGVPGRLDGSSRLADTGERASAMTLSGQVRVSIPLVGGKVEGLIVEQVVELLDAEARFTSEWLARRA